VEKLRKGINRAKGNRRKMLQRQLGRLLAAVEDSIDDERDAADKASTVRSGGEVAQQGFGLTHYHHSHRPNSPHTHLAPTRPTPSSPSAASVARG